VQANVTTRIHAVATQAEVDATPITSDTGDPGTHIGVRFQARAEADSFWSDVQAAFGTGINGPVTGSYIWRYYRDTQMGTPDPNVITERVAF